MTRGVAGALAAAAALAVVACAQPGSPPGGEVDRSPPRVVAVTPEPFDTLSDLRAPVVIQFDERISERLEGVAEFSDAVLISPATGEVRAERKRRSLEIIPAGGWEEGYVYQVVVLPVFRDLFNNQRVEPIDLIFSTGGRFPETALIGFVEDRLTGELVTNARVEAVRRIDGTRYVAVTDTGGFFAMRALPAGAYDLQAWLDQNRDRTPDFFETQDTTEAVFGVADTAFVEMALLPMDTTPARLARAEVIDSLKVRLVFDDHFATGPVAGSARVYLAPDTTLVTAEGRLVHGSRLDSILALEAEAREAARAEQAREDSIRAVRDSVRALQDSLGIAEDSARLLVLGPDTVPPPRPEAEQPARPEARPAAPPAREQRPGQQPGRGGREEDQGPLPSTELILLLPDTLRSDTRYFVEVEGVVNIRGLPGGGGFAPFETPPDTATVDTAAVDSAAGEPGDEEAANAVPPDSVGIGRDSVRRDSVPPDTVPPDSVPPLAPAEASPPAIRRAIGGLHE